MAHQPLAASLRWLSRPVTLAALALLILNDRVLKWTWGNWFTGKLSDVAWLVVAPPLFATALALAAAVTNVATRPSDDVRARGSVPSSPRPGGRDVPPGNHLARVALAVVTVGFVVTKTTSGGAALASTVLTALAGPSRVLADPADLLALPALVLAWWTWRRASRGAGAAPGRPVRGPGPLGATRAVPGTPRPAAGTRRALWPLVVLPVAVLATVATSVPPSTAPRLIHSSEDAVLVGVTDGWSMTYATWYVTTDGRSWERTEHWPGTEVPVATYLERGDLPRLGCVPDRPSVCFRPVDGEELGVLRSDDGGVTWVPDWYLSPEDQHALAGRYSADHEPLVSHGVAIVTTDDGFRVYAVNGGDGVAVRREDGTWERLGFPWSSDPVVPLPGEPTTWNRPLPWAVTVGVLAAMVPLLASGRRDRSRTLAGWLAGAAVPLAVAAALNVRWSVAEGQAVAADFFLIGPVAAFVTLAALHLPAAALVVVGGLRTRGAATTSVALACGVAVGAVTWLLTPAPLAATGALAVLTGGVLAARHLQGQPVPDPHGPGPWSPTEPPPGRGGGPGWTG